MMLPFEGKAVLVTGAAVGIGLATAQQFAAKGAAVVMVDRDEAKLSAEAAILAGKGYAVLPLVCDVSDEAQVQSVCRTALERFGRVDILVNNAGVWRRWMPFTETDRAMWESYIGVNILGTMSFTRALLPQMLEGGWGRVINLGSVAGVYGNANMADYSMTKGAVIAFTKALAKEVTARGVTVNCVSPGSVSNEQDVPAPSDLSFLGRTGTHTENANLICFLASDEAAYISGQNIQCDGCRKKM